MKHKTIHHEILLFTGTRFTSREFCSRDEENQNGKKLSAMEELEKACWDGMLYELLPELAENPSAKNENFIWHIMSGKNFLNISLGSSVPVIENEISVDPYLFLNDTRQN